MQNTDLHFLVQAEVDGFEWVEMFDSHTEANWFLQELEEEFGDQVRNVVFDAIEVVRRSS